MDTIIENKSKRSKVGIVIPFYEGIDYFPNLFQSIHDATQITGDAENFKVIVIDNSESDYSDFFKNYSDNLIYLKEKKKLGYGRACNVGYCYCREHDFEYIIITNQDGTFDKNCFAELLSAMNNHQEIALASALPVTYQTGEIEPFFIKYYLQYVPALITDSIRNCMAREHAYQIEKVPGVCFIFRLNGTYQESYLFDEKMFMYFEDEDLCKRLNDRNEKIVLVPDAVFHHQHSHTTDIDNSKKIDRQNAISARYLRIKYAKNKLASLYGITIDDMFDSLKQLLRGNVVYGVDKTIVGFKLLSLLLRKKTNNN